LCAELIIFCLTSFIGYRSGKREPKIGAVTQFGLDPNSSAVVLHDFLADGQSHPVTWVLSPSMEPLENLKNQVFVFFGNANPVVKHRKQPFTALWFSGNGDAGIPFGAKFDGIADKILEQLHYLKTISQNRRQRMAGNSYGVFFQHEVQILQNFIDG
jgi:hypothetical protein